MAASDIFARGYPRLLAPRRNTRRHARLTWKTFKYNTHKSNPKNRYSSTSSYRKIALNDQNPNRIIHRQFAEH